MQFVSIVFALKMVVAVVLLSLLTTVWIYFLWSRRKYNAFALKMPGPSGLPVIGIVHEVYNMADILYKLPEYASQYKVKTFFTWLGIHPMIYTMDTKFSEIILNSPDCFNKSVLYEVVNDVMGDGLVTSKCPRWNNHRKLLSPWFYHKVALEFFPDFNIFANELCAKLDKDVNCGEVNVKDHVFKTTLKSILSTTMAIDFKQESDMRFLDHFERVVGMTTQRALKPWLANSILFRFSSMYKPFMESHTFIVKFVREVVMRRLKVVEQQGLNENDIKTNTTEEPARRARQIYIDQAIKIHQRNEFTLEDIFQEANTIIVAGFETTATTLFSTLMCLAMHPKYQELVFEEIVTIFPEEEFDVAYEDLENLVYLDMCIDETLRTTATVPMIIRESTSDVQISEGVVIPKGTQIAVDIFNIQRDADTWGPDANIFNPDNVTKENLADKHKYSYLPFSKGPRNCMGWHYARMTMKVVLSKVLRKYRFSTSFPFEDLRYVFLGTMKYQKVPYLEVQRR